MVLVDGNHIIPNIGFRQQAIIKGDSKVFAIAAASIVAKVVRDKIMSDFSELYPQYGFEKNKGYGTKDHLQALRQHGACPIHRRTYAPIKNFV
jgi:ribonuclease HII